MAKAIKSVEGKIHATKHRNRYRVRLKITYHTGEYTYKEFTGKTQLDAETRAMDFKELFARTGHIRISEEGLRNFRESMQEYVERHRFPKVKSSSYDLIIQNLNNQIFPALGDKMVCDIDSDDIRDLMTDLCLRKYSYSILKKTYTNLNNYFAFLKKNGDLEINPMAQIERPTNRTIDRERINRNVDTSEINNEVIREFTSEEIALIKKAVSARHGNGKKKYKDSEAFLLILNSGLRAGELLGLRHCNIDLVNKKMRICENLTTVRKREGTKLLKGNTTQIGTTKNGRERTVPLNQACIDAIEAIKKERYLGEDSFLICNNKGKPLCYNAFRKRFCNLLRYAGVEERGLHSLRHTFATRLAAGSPTHPPLSVAQIAALLGQSTEEVTQRYFHLENHMTELTDGFEF